MQSESIQTPGDASKSPGDAKKYGIVAVLVVVLLIAVLTMPDEKPIKKPNATTASTQSSDTGNVPSEKSKAADRAKEAISRFTLVRTLSRMSIDEAMQTSLFDPESTPRPTAHAAPLKVQSVYGSSVAQSALVGSTIVRQGESLSDGRKVIKITGDGIQLAR